MTTENLKQQLLNLHAALLAGEPLDPEMVTLLQMLDVDIRARLTQPPPLSPAPTQTHAEIFGTPDTPGQSALTSRAQEISARFAAKHPHLEPVLRELTDTLQRIGI